MNNKNTAQWRYLCYACLQLRNTLAERGLRPQAYWKYSKSFLKIKKVWIVPASSENWLCTDYCGILMNMKKLFLVAVLFIGLLSFPTSAEARTTSVRGYYKPSTGAYIMPHYKTTPNRTKLDNFSTKGNHNPYTGKSGTVNPYR